MKITILPQGSRGDVQPYVALGVGLQQAGHQVTIPTADLFRPLVTEAGLQYVAVQGLSPQVFVRQPEVQAALRRGGQLQLLVTLLKQAGPLIQTFLDEYWRVSAEADLLVANTMPFGAVDCAVLRGIPWAHAALHALEPTRAFPNPFFSAFGLRLHSALNPVTHTFLRFVMWQMFRGELNRWRRKHGAPPHSFNGYYGWLQAQQRPHVYGFSPSVLPRPTDWPANHHMTGYWFLDEANWQPPAALVRFLEAGPPPVVVGFGSMDDQNPERLTRVVLEALQLSAQRGVLLSGWGGFGAVPLPPTVFRLEAAPHRWLFPHAAALVHHGGAGTTAAGLRAGIPAIITPVGADQPFWATRLEQLGVGVRGADFLRLTANRLATDLQRVLTDTSLRTRAAAFGTQIQAETGVAEAVKIITT